MYGEVAKRVLSSFASMARSVRPGDVLIALALVFAAVQAARLTWTVVTPLAPIGDWKQTAVDIVPASERPALFGSFDPFFRSQQAASSSEVVTSLPLTLFGIRTNEASGGGSAIIAGADGVQNSWSVGETIMPGAVLHSTMS